VCGCQSEPQGAKFETRGEADGKEGTQAHKEGQETPCWETPAEGLDPEAELDAGARDTTRPEYITPSLKGPNSNKGEADGKEDRQAGEERQETPCRETPEEDFDLEDDQLLIISQVREGGSSTVRHARSCARPSRPYCKPPSSARTALLKDESSSSKLSPKQGDVSGSPKFCGTLNCKEELTQMA
jgi:hypothetical protein